MAVSRSQPGHAGQNRRPTFFDAVTRRNSIRGILLFIVLVAFVPTLLLSTWQGATRLARDADAEQSRLADAAIATSRSEGNIIAETQRVLAVLAIIPAIRGREPAGCGAVLSTVTERFPELSHVAVAAPDGRMGCASNRRAGDTGFGDAALWGRLQTGGFILTPPVWDPTSQRPVLRALLPLRTATGRFDGAIVASIDLVRLRDAVLRRGERTAAAVAIVDGTGRPVVRSRPLPWNRLVMPPKATGDGRIPILTAPDAEGHRWSYAVAPLHVSANLKESFYIVHADAQPPHFGADRWAAVAFFVLPLLALILTACAVWFGANRAILRWVSHLAALARQIGSGDATQPAHRSGFANAPSEVRDLAAELLRVGNVIADREHRLRRSVAAQNAVARELHHRVRNNLQVMASFLSLQAESLPSGPTRQVLEAAQLRVATMAMVNGLLYADTEVATVSLASLLDPVAELLSRHIGIAAEVVVDPDLAPRTVDIDRALPLSLWIVEAAVCLFERVDTGSKPRLFTVAITSEDDSMCIVVAMRGPLPAPARHSLHRRLVTAIAHQLGGRSRIDAVGPAGARVVLCLPHGELNARPDMGFVGLTTGIAA